MYLIVLSTYFCFFPSPFFLSFVLQLPFQLPVVFWKMPTSTCFPFYNTVEINKYLQTFERETRYTCEKKSSVFPNSNNEKFVVVLALLMFVLFFIIYYYMHNIFHLYIFFVIVFLLLFVQPTVQLPFIFFFLLSLSFESVSLSLSFSMVNGV